MARATGALRFNREIAAKGEPQGYMVMEFTPGVDIAYLELYDTITNKTTRKYCTPSQEALIFSVTPTPGVTSGEIRVTDLFGNVYTEKITW